MLTCMAVADHETEKKLHFPRSGFGLCSRNCPVPAQLFRDAQLAKETGLDFVLGWLASPHRLVLEGEIFSSILRPGPARLGCMATVGE